MSKALHTLLLAVLVTSTEPVVFSHGLIQNPPSRNWFCGATTKPDQVLNLVAQYPVCGEAFANDFNGGYNFMSVLTHAQGRSVVRPLPQNVCGFNSETWQGRNTPWDQPINWPTTNLTSGPQTISWNISWGPHYSDTKEFRYWITKPGFQFQVGKALAWSDFEETAFCSLEYSDSNPSGNPNVIPDKAASLFHTKCTVPERTGRHIIYGEWGRNQYTYERFHSCVDVVFRGAAGPDFALTAAPATVALTRGGSLSSVVTIARAGGFSEPVVFTATGLPAGVTATFNSILASGGNTTLTLTASSTAAFGPAAVTVTGRNGLLARSATIDLNVNAPGDFALSSSSSNLSVARGSNVTSTIAISRSGGFAGPVALTATGLASGVSAVFNPVSVTGAAASLTLTASSTAALGGSTATVTGNQGAISRSVSIPLTVTATSNAFFSLSVPAGSLNLAQGGSGTINLAISRTGGFASAVSFSASELPSGITAAFDPAVVSGNSTNVRLSASSAAITGSGTILVTGIGANISKTVMIPFTVKQASAPGNLTITPVINANQPWYNEIAVKLSNTAPVTALEVSIKVQRTPGVSFNSQYNTVGGQIQQSSSSTSAVITYIYKLVPGQTLTPGTHRIFAAQASGTGTPHPTSGDTYSVTYTIGQTTATQSGSF